VPGLAVLVALTTLAGCGDDAGDDDAERYGDGLRERFVGDCTAAGESEPVCGCFYDALAANVPIERFLELDEQIREGPGPVPEDVVDLAVACGADPTFAPGPPATP
jgi:hypothetical protein